MRFGCFRQIYNSSSPPISILILDQMALELINIEFSQGDEPTQQSGSCAMPL
jgi:hypothetical protein